MSDDPRSLLSFYRDCIALRKRHASLMEGEFIPWLTGNDDVLAFYRTMPEETTAVLINFSDGERRIVSGTGTSWKVIYGTADNAGVLGGLNCTLAPGEVLILKA